MEYRTFLRALRGSDPLCRRRSRCFSASAITSASAAASNRTNTVALPAGSELAGKSNLTPRIHEKLQLLQTKHAALNQRMSGDVSGLGREELARLSKDLNDTGLIVGPYSQLLQHYSELVELQHMIDSKDKSLQQMAREEKTGTLEAIAACEREVVSNLLPRDTTEKANAILELRAGTGGSEASLFCGELLQMYHKFSLLRGWKFNKMSVNEDGDKVKDAVVEVSGSNVFGVLMFESGTHRVQRVPATESQGRVHTSTVTVAVLPEAADVHVEIKESDLRIECYRASGPGGQHLNTTDSAVRITHVPTGIVAENQQERSQFKNKEKAMKVIRAKLFDMERQRVDKERRASRNKLIGTGNRSEKIRTYNFAQNRVTDHRINYSLYDIEGIMNGTESMQQIVDQLRMQHDLDGLANLD
ncbi:Peptide chain release factor 1, mitochondrial [Coemansia sp. RSA 1933]|nr:Peptide chain release factor 1, mitochondrial [Coemansia sp. RSA 1933]